MSVISSNEMPTEFIVGENIWLRKGKIIIETNNGSYTEIPRNSIKPDIICDGNRASAEAESIDKVFKALKESQPHLSKITDDDLKKPMQLLKPGEYLKIDGKLIALTYSRKIPTYFDTAKNGYNYLVNGKDKIHSGDINHNNGYLSHLINCGNSEDGIIYITSFKQSILKEWERNPPIMIFITDEVVYYMILKMTPDEVQNNCYSTIGVITTIEREQYLYIPMKQQMNSKYRIPNVPEDFYTAHRINFIEELKKKIKKDKENSERDSLESVESEVPEAAERQDETNESNHTFDIDCIFNYPRTPNTIDAPLYPYLSGDASSQCILGVAPNKIPYGTIIKYTSTKAYPILAKTSAYLINRIIFVIPYDETKEVQFQNICMATCQAGPKSIVLLQKESGELIYVYGTINDIIPNTTEFGSKIDFTLEELSALVYNPSENCEKIPINSEFKYDFLDGTLPKNTSEIIMYLSGCSNEKLSHILPLIKDCIYCSQFHLNDVEIEKFKTELIHLFNELKTNPIKEEIPSLPKNEGENPEDYLKRFKEHKKTIRRIKIDINKVIKSIQGNIERMISYKYQITMNQINTILKKQIARGKLGIRILGKIHEGKNNHQISEKPFNDWLQTIEEEIPECEGTCIEILKPSNFILLLTKELNWEQITECIFKPYSHWTTMPIGDIECMIEDKINEGNPVLPANQAQTWIMSWNNGHVYEDKLLGFLLLDYNTSTLPIHFQEESEKLFQGVMRRYYQRFFKEKLLNRENPMSSSDINTFLIIIMIEYCKSFDVESEASIKIIRSLYKTVLCICAQGEIPWSFVYKMFQYDSVNEYSRPELIGKNPYDLMILDELIKLYPKTKWEGREIKGNAIWLVLRIFLTNEMFKSKIDEEIEERRIAAEKIVNEQKMLKETHILVKTNKKRIGNCKKCDKHTCISKRNGFCKTCIEECHQGKLSNEELRKIGITHEWKSKDEIKKEEKEKGENKKSKAISEKPRNELEVINDKIMQILGGDNFTIKENNINIQHLSNLMKTLGLEPSNISKMVEYFFKEFMSTLDVKASEIKAVNKIRSDLNILPTLTQESVSFSD